MLSGDNVGIFYKEQQSILVLYGPRREKTCLRGFANNTRADQPAQSDQRLCYSLFGKYHICKLATSEI